MDANKIDPNALLNCDTVDESVQLFSFYGNHSYENEPGPGKYRLHEGMVTGDQQCPDCDGTGTDYTDCNYCDGSGTEENEDGERVECEECRGDGALDEDCDTCDGRGEWDPDEGDPDAWHPIQSRMWHLPHFDIPDNWRDCLVSTTVVEIDGNHYLALTGCGMNLSWEIAESFIRLGYRPPAGLRLATICGRGHSEQDQAIAEICRESKRILMRWMESGIEDIDRAVKFGIEHEAKRAGAEA
jgi:hypothetical protein